MAVTSNSPCSLVIFGATGDLTRRKLLPAVYQLRRDGLLPDALALVGVARREWSAETWRKHVADSVREYARVKPVDEGALQSMLEHADYVVAPFDDAGGYGRLSTCLERSEAKPGMHCNRLFYLATPPEHYAKIVEHLGRVGLAQPRADGWTRLVVEKPFGQDRASAIELNRTIHRAFDERQLFRIDHYLGKETVQNILVFRFANAVFEPVWTRHYVDHVQITVAEQVGVEGRAEYYEKSGVSRDILQNHLLQLLSLTTMEAPVAFDADAVRDEKVKVLKALRPMAEAEVGRLTVRGQYAAGRVGDKRVAGYKDEAGVKPDSSVETFLVIQARVDNWRWMGVPFYLRSGKRLAKRTTEIAIQFKPVPVRLFGRTAAAGLEPNRLTLQIQPDEGISLTSNSKQPGLTMRIEPVRLDFRYGTSGPEAYERLLLDCLIGDPTLFTRADEVEAAWAFVDSIRQGWQASGEPPLRQYAAGTWGPPEAGAFIEQDGRAWREL